jgi:hypothetical protein
VTHGTRSTYQGGCRCLPCRAANAAYSQTYRAILRRGEHPAGQLQRASTAWRLIYSLRSEWFSQAEVARRLGYAFPKLQFNHRQMRGTTIAKVQRFYQQTMNDADV